MVDNTKVGTIYSLFLRSSPSQDSNTIGYINILPHRHREHAANHAPWNNVQFVRSSNGSPKLEKYNDPSIAKSAIAKIIHRNVCCFFVIEYSKKNKFFYVVGDVYCGVYCFKNIIITAIQITTHIITIVIVFFRFSPV